MPPITTKFIPIHDLGVGMKVDQFKFIKLIGKGSYGQVWKVFDKVNRQYLAVKKSNCIPNRRILATYLKELDVINYITKYSNISQICRIPKYYGYFASNQKITPGKQADVCQRLYIVMDIIPGMSLSIFIQKSSLRTSKYLMNILYQLVQKLEHLHGAGLAHRDIKPDNVMIDVKLGGIADWIDFGLACIDQNKSKFANCLSGKLTVGTPHYMAPEVWQGWINLSSIIDVQKADIFSLGVMFYKVLTKNPYFIGKTKQELRNNTIKGHFRTLKKVKEPGMAELISMMTKLDPKNRPNIVQVREIMSKMVSEDI